jgi:hypothetical protein
MVSKEICKVDPNTNLSENSLEFNFPDWLKFFYKFNKIKIL